VGSDYRGLSRTLRAVSPVLSVVRTFRYESLRVSLALLRNEIPQWNRTNPGILTKPLGYLAKDSFLSPFHARLAG
jgi:hypothetical protein